MDDDVVSTVVRSLDAGEAVRIEVPGGRIHIDRLLPFLALHRRPDRDDPGTADLLLGEAAYVLVGGGPELTPRVDRLVSSIAEVQHRHFGASLLLELWARPLVRGDEDLAFRIFAPTHRVPSSLLEEFETVLLGVEIDDQAARVDLAYDDQWAPPGLPRLAGEPTGGFLHLGLEVPAIHYDADTGTVYPFELRALRHALGHALKRVFYEFIHSCTSSRPAHFHQLGRQAMTEVVLDVDRELADLSDDFDLILHVTPVNGPQAATEFEAAGSTRPPEFLYRPRTVDPDAMKRRLYSVPIDHIEDPTLAHIFHEKRDELDRQLTLVADRNTPRFLLGSRALYGDIEPELHGLALTMLGRIEPGPGIAHAGGVQVLAELAMAEIAAYRQIDPGLRSTVEVRPDIPGVMVSQGNLLIGRHASVSRDRLMPLIAHEIGTHALTHHNGRHQQFRELYAGMAGYESLQEGLGVLSEFLVGGLGSDRLRQLAGRVVAAARMVDGADFVETYTDLEANWGFAPERAFDITMRLFRGGGFTKDVVYLRGLIEVLDYLATGAPLERLYVGKVSSPYLSLVEELEWRNLLSSPRLLPRHLDDPLVAERLARCQAGMTVMDLVDEVTG